MRRFLLALGVFVVVEVAALSVVVTAASLDPDIRVEPLAGLVVVGGIVAMVAYTRRD